ncbi:MAG: hypothetical protein MJE66_13955 [Proteobacteria bacterium]|nr:hypothetical protein [Pseudomonadota bacterium]
MSLLFALLALAACRSKITVNGIEVYENYWKQATTAIEPLATFQMDCPAEQLEYLLLKRTGRAPTQVSVQGCGQKALFVRRTVSAGNMMMIGDWELGVPIQPLEPEQKERGQSL